MREVVVVVVNPFVDGDFEVKRVIPIITPDDIFFDGAHDTFGVGIAFRIRPGCKDLFDAEQRAVHHESLRRRLTSVVGD